MPKIKRQGKVYFKKLVQSVRDSSAVPMYRKLRHAIDGSTTEDELVNILNQCPIQALQYKDDKGQFLLHLACQHIGYEKFAILLWEKYPNAAFLQKKWINYRNPLQIACNVGRLDMVQTLITGSSNLINEHDAHGKTALFYACAKDQIEVIQLLMTNSSIDVNHQDKYGQTALHICCYNLSFRSIELLMNETNLHMRETAFEIFCLIVSTYCIPDKMAVHHILRLFLHKLPEIKDTNSRKSNIIHAHVSGRWPIFYAFDFFMNNDYEALINQQDNKGNTPLHYACKSNANTPCNHVKKLLEQPSLLHNVRNDKGRTPFHDACFHFNYWLVDVFFEDEGADSNMIDYGGENALHHLIHGFIKSPNNIGKCINTIRILLNNNPFLVKLHNNFGETAYDYACAWRKINHGRQSVIMNGKPRRYHSMQMNRQIWTDIVSMLESYRVQARFRMFNHFMEKGYN
jgi:ankyrin repeat protein